MYRFAKYFVALGLLLLRAGEASAHGDVMLVGSTQTNAGALVADYDYSIVSHATPSVSLGGTTIYTTIYPSFEWPSVDDGTLHLLKTGTPILIQIVTIDPGLAVRLGSTRLDAAGKSGKIGDVTAGDHVHPEWQISLPDGVIATFHVTFRLTTTTRPYTQSAVYELVFDNAPVSASPTPTATIDPTPEPNATATPTATPTLAATPTPTPSPSSTKMATATASATTTPTTTFVRGDANCDGTVSAADLPAEVAVLATTTIVRCGTDLDDNGVIDEQDVSLLIEGIFTP